MAYTYDEIYNLTKNGISAIIALFIKTVIICFKSGTYIIFK